MNCVTFLHTADLHLGRPLGFLPPAVAEERRRDQRRALSRICDLAIRRGVDLFMVAGDLFDSPNPDPTDREAFASDAARLVEAGIKVFIVPGNHDRVTRNSFWPQFQMDGLHIFIEPEWKSVVVEDLGVVVSGMGFSRDASTKRAFDGLDNGFDMPVLAVVHASYEAFEGQIERYYPFSAAELGDAGVSYAALGHYHRYSTISQNGATACYPGTPEGISFDAPEVEDRYAIIGTLDDSGVSLEPVKTNARTMKSVDIDCTSFGSETALIQAVRRLCDASALLQVRLSGTPCAETAAAVDELQDRFRESCFYFSIDRNGISMPVRVESDDHTIRGRFCSSMLKQIDACAEPERKRTLSRALELGLRAFAED